MAEVAGFDAKEQVRQATDIVDLVGSYLPLRREGRNYKALCPWHDDSKPSLQVNPQRQSFKCWVCNIGGDIFSFVMKMENVEFVEALNLLAEKAGIQIDRRGARGDSTDDRQLLFKVLNWAEDQFHHYLVESPEAEVARRYFDDRGLTDESIGKYRLGFSPDRWDWLAQKAFAAGFAEALLEKAGLVISREENSGCYDRFRGRALFPIHDPQGRTIAFGGRVLPQFADKTPAKYINSPETPLFSKHRVLYGLNSAREPLAKTKTALIMEGYTDCIMARQFGIANSVAVLGTALTGDHIDLLLRQGTEKVVLVLDGDTAGQKRTNEILSLYLNKKVDLRVLTLPNQLDPCDFLTERGKEAFVALEQKSIDAFFHVVLEHTKGLSTDSSAHEISVAIDNILKIIAPVPTTSQGGTKEQVFRVRTVLSQLSRKLGVQEEALVARLQEFRKELTPRSTSASNSENQTIKIYNPLADIRTWSPFEQELIELILKYPEAVLKLADIIPSVSITSPDAQVIYRTALSLAFDGWTATLESMMNTLEDERYKNILVELDERSNKRSLSNKKEEWLQLFLESIERDKFKKETAMQQRVLNDDSQSEEVRLAALAELFQKTSLKHSPK